ncbi:calcium-binding protein 39-like [Platysternon megacephalum]|uniref:Calcium-binding protein 39-like n=1 Tax=Platysternon megacephalum TaxID=55544 RepID=A0A4D9EHQ8_9SAUR|nr:calcium-binding protein 39-like [Platysternon megacephalum]
MGARCLTSMQGRMTPEPRLHYCFHLCSSRGAQRSEERLAAADASKGHGRGEERDGAETVTASLPHSVPGPGTSNASKGSSRVKLIDIYRAWQGVSIPAQRATEPDHIKQASSASSLG